MRFHDGSSFVNDDEGIPLAYEPGSGDDRAIAMTDRIVGTVSSITWKLGVATPVDFVRDQDGLEPS